MSNTTIPSTRKDIAWNYATCSDPKNPNIVGCIFCGKITNGGIYRHKLHLVGGNSNEWLLGKFDDSDKKNDNDFVYEGEDLRWSDVARASGVGESAYGFRSRNASSSKGASSSTSVKRKQSSVQISLAEEEEINLDDETEEEDTDGYKSSDGADDVDLDVEDEEDDYFDN